MVLVVKHIQIEDLGTISGFFEKNKVLLKKIELAEGDKLPENLDEVKAVITLGGPMNVYQEKKYPFLRQEDKLLKEAIKKEIPVLGICLGAQLLAKACGAEVKRAKNKEVGWYKIKLAKEGIVDPLFSSLRFTKDEEIDVFQWHEDTFELPEGARLLATSGDCKNQAFRIGKNIYGFQFHLEVTPSIIASWLNYYLDKKQQAKINAENIIKQAYDKSKQMTNAIYEIMFNFYKLAFKNYK